MADKLLLPAKIEDLSPIQKGYLTICQRKESLVKELIADELGVQGKLKEIEKNTDWESVKKLIAEAKELTEIGKEKRLVFSRFIDEKVLSPLMDYEKRNWTLLTAANEHELKLRKAAVKKQDHDNKRASELAAYKAHIQNEWFRIANEYRFALTQLVTESYTAALKQKQDPKTIDKYITSIKTFLKDVKMPVFTKYERKKYTDEKGVELFYIPNDEAKKLFDEVDKYNPADDFKAAIESVDEMFKNYKADLKNATKAVEAIETKLEEQKEQVTEAIETETATNNLVSKASSFTVSGGGKKAEVKVKWKIIEENTDAWAFAVISAFIKNAEAAKKFLRVKTWANLSIGQMATALGNLVNEDDKIKLQGLALEEIEK